MQFLKKRGPGWGQWKYRVRGKQGRAYAVSLRCTQWASCIPLQPEMILRMAAADGSELISFMTRVLVPYCTDPNYVMPCT